MTIFPKKKKKLSSLKKHLKKHVHVLTLMFFCNKIIKCMVEPHEFT